MPSHSVSGGEDEYIDITSNYIENDRFYITIEGGDGGAGGSGHSETEKVAPQSAGGEGGAADGWVEAPNATGIDLAAGYEGEDGETSQFQSASPADGGDGGINPNWTDGSNGKDGEDGGGYRGAGSGGGGGAATIINFRNDGRVAATGGGGGGGAKGFSAFGSVPNGGDGGDSGWINNTNPRRADGGDGSTSSSTKGDKGEDGTVETNNITNQSLSSISTSGDGYASISWTTLSPPDYSPTITSITSSANPVEVGVQFTVNFDVTNSGGTTEPYDVELLVDGTVRKTDTGVTGTGPKSISYTPSSADEGDNRDIKIRLSHPAGSDSASTTIDIKKPDTFNLTITDVNDPVDVGDTLNVDVQIKNDGDVQGTKDVEFLRQGSIESTSTKTLGTNDPNDPKDSKSITFSYGTGSQDADSNNDPSFTVKTPDDSITFDPSIFLANFVEGTVTKNGSPVQGATIRVIRTGQNTDAYEKDTTSNSDGTWKIDKLPDKPLHCMVEYKEGGTIYRDFSLPFIGQTGSQVYIPPDRNLVDFQLESQGSVSQNSLDFSFDYRPDPGDQITSNLSLSGSSEAIARDNASINISFNVVESETNQYHPEWHFVPSFTLRKNVGTETDPIFKDKEIRTTNNLTETETFDQISLSFTTDEETYNTYLTELKENSGKIQQDSRFDGQYRAFAKKSGNLYRLIPPVDRRGVGYEGRCLVSDFTADRQEPRGDAYRVDVTLLKESQREPSDDLIVQSADSEEWLIDFDSGGSHPYDGAIATKNIDQQSITERASGIASIELELLMTPEQTRVIREIPTRLYEPDGAPPPVEERQKKDASDLIIDNTINDRQTIEIEAPVEGGEDILAPGTYIITSWNTEWLGSAYRVSLSLASK